MVVETIMFKELCSKILQAVSKSDSTPITETLELKTQEGFLYLSVTNREYYVSVKFPIEYKEEFHATVNAASFLKLVSQITSEHIDLKCTDKYVSIKANGSYKVPLIFNEDKLLDLPQITIDNVLSTFDIETSILKSIARYNTRGVAKKVFADVVQSTYYIDDQGCITFSQGACVNNFQLEKPVKFLLSDTVVRLFKLFTSSSVHFTLGIDPLNDLIMQTKVSFEDELVKMTVITPNASIDRMPAAAIRATANASYGQSIVLSRMELLQALNRLAAVEGSKKFTYGIFTCLNNELTIEDLQRNNSEVLKYKDGSLVREPYTFTLELNSLKVLLSDWAEDYINLRCGNSQSIVIKRGDVLDVIPEVKVNV